MPVVSFATDILPLFKKNPDNIAHMTLRGFMLAEYSFMSVPENAQATLGRLTATTGRIMPPPPAQPWTAAQIDLFKAWIAGGYQP
jgi:hypothetical protein